MTLAANLRLRQTVADGPGFYHGQDSPRTLRQRRLTAGIWDSFPVTEAKDVKARLDGDAVAMELVPKEFRLKN